MVGLTHSDIRFPLMMMPVPSTTLDDWIEGLPQLQNLSVWTGSALSQQVGKKIRDHCPEFKQLRIYIWYGLSD
jgi:hypothetical protein